MTTFEKIRVLYVDDEINNLVAFRANFRRHYEIFTATSAQEGLDIADREDINVIITDQRMPGINGTTFLELIAKKHPHPVKMLLTGYSDIETIVDAVNKAHIYKYVTKPWTNEELMKAIEECYRSYYTSKKIRDQIQRLAHTNEQLEIALIELLAT